MARHCYMESPNIHDSFSCSLKQGHTGEHRAHMWHDPSADLLTSWPNEQVSEEEVAEAVASIMGTGQGQMGYTQHPDLTPWLADQLNSMVANLRLCVNDHPEDERLAQVEAHLRWLLGRRV